MKNIVFIGDSITDGGTFISITEAFMRANGRDDFDKYINLGVSSENTTALTEPGHPFPRPCIFDRLDSFLKNISGEWAVVMYGENDAVYQPFDESRFSLYKRGITKLVDELHKASFKVALMTPTPFDAKSFNGDLSYDKHCSFGCVYANYNEVMQKYAEWIINCGIADKTVDVYSPIMQFLSLKRSTDSSYKTGDGIHQGGEGNFIIAKVILNTLFDINIGSYESTPIPAVYRLIAERNGLYHRYYKELVGHGNPYKEKEISYNRLTKKVARLDKKINKALNKWGRE